MKKILILVSLVALVASGLFAQAAPVLSGQINFGYQNTFDGTGVKATPDTQISITATPDAANTGTIRLRLNNTSSPFAEGTSTVEYDRLHFTTNYLGAFGVAMDDLVKVTGQYGLNEYDIANVFDYDSIDVDFAKQQTYWGFRQAVTVLKMVNVSLAYSLSDNNLAADYIAPLIVDAWASIPIAGVGTAKAEVAFGTGTTTYAFAKKTFTGAGKLAEGWMIVGGAFDYTAIAGLTASVGVGYDLELNTKVGALLDKAADDSLLASVKAAYDTDLFGAYGTFSYKMAIDSDDNKTNNYTLVPFAVGASYMKKVGLDLGVMLDLSATDALPTKIGSGDKQGSFDLLDVSAWVAAGKATLRLGYLMVPDKETIAYDKYKAETGDYKGLYFEANLAY